MVCLDSKVLSWSMVAHRRPRTARLDPKPSTLADSNYTVLVGGVRFLDQGFGFRVRVEGFGKMPWILSAA